MESFSNNDFNAVYQQTKSEIYRYLLKKCKNISDIDDLFQDTYIAVFRFLDDGGTIENSEAFVKTIAKRTLSKYYSILRKREMHESELTDNIPAPEGEDGELADRIYELIMKKPEKIRKVFFMRHTLDLSFAEISAELGMSESSVKAKYYKTKEEIKRKIEKEETR